MLITDLAASFWQLSLLLRGTVVAPVDKFGEYSSSHNF